MPQTSRRTAQPGDFYDLRTVTDPQISPDGKQVAYVVATSDREVDEMRIAVHVAPVDGKRPARRFTFGKRDHSPRWSPDGRYLAFVSDRGEKNQIFIAPLDGGEARQVTKAKFGVMSPAWSPDGARIAYTARTGDYKESKERKPAERAAPRVIRDLRYRLDGIGYFDVRRIHIFTVDVETGAETQITGGDWFDDQPSWSPDGKCIAFVSDRDRNRHQRHWRTDVWVVPSAGGRARKLTRGKGGAAYPAFSPDGRKVAFVGHENGDAGDKNTHLLVVPVAGGAPPRSLSASLDRPAFGFPAAAGRTFAWLPRGEGVLFLASDRGTIALFRAGVANGSVSKVLDGERQIDAFALTPDGQHVAFSAQWASEPAELYVTALGERARERNLSHANDDLRAQVEYAPTRRMSVRAPDGLEVESFVLFPPGYKRGRRYPLVLDIHGGPHGTHPFQFRMRFQSLAAAGYVVVMPNPRGSTGYGESFAAGCVRDWGGKDYEDLMATVDALVRRGVADPAQLYVQGYSYGGFMTTWVVGHTDRFRAGVIGAPAADEVSMFGTTDIPRFAIYEIGGTPWSNPDGYRKHSATTYLPNVKTPVLLMHHEGDLRCPISQAEEIFQGLKVMGKEVEFVRYPGGFHTFATHTPSQQVDGDERILAWYAAHAPARPRRTARPAAPRRARRSRTRTPVPA
ncbi:MAG: S9 family peptidase [Dehalococcoidia bacterium]